LGLKALRQCGPSQHERNPNVNFLHLDLPCARQCGASPKRITCRWLLVAAPEW
jgi:hypothetical protein